MSKDTVIIIMKISEKNSFILLSLHFDRRVLKAWWGQFKMSETETDFEVEFLVTCT